MGVLGDMPSSAHIALVFKRTRAPNTSDDSSQGYSPGVLWLDESTQKIYINVASGVGSAAWVEFVAQTPPAGDVLRDSPPTLSSPVNYTLTNATNNTSVLGAGAGRDLILNQTEVLNGALAQLNNWRHVVHIGGELNIVSGSDVMAYPVRNITGTVFLEGVYIRGASVADCFVMRSPETTQGMDVVLQNCRFEHNYQGGEHPDNTQFQNAKVDSFRIDKCTFYCETQGTFMRVGVGATDYAKNIDFNRLNFRGIGPNRFWQTWEGGNSTSVLKQIVPVTLNDVWIAKDGDTRPDIGRRVVPDSSWFDGIQSNSRRGAIVETDAQGQYVRWSDGSQLAPNGQQSLDCEITGIIRDGIPPGGDFVPAVVGTDLGVNYVSPGYA